MNNKAALTAEEKKAVDDFIAAAKALPPSIYIELTGWDEDDEDPELTVGKREAPGMGVQVAELKKPSLVF